MVPHWIIPVFTGVHCFHMERFYMYYVLVPRSIERRNQLLTDISVTLEVELLSCLSSPTLASSYMNYVLVPRSIYRDRRNQLLADISVTLKSSRSLI